MLPNKQCYSRIRRSGWLGIIFLWAFLCLTAGALADDIPTASPSYNLFLKAGIGYEFLSQNFFLDSLDLSGSDSLETVTQLKTNYLDDIKGQLSLRYQPTASRDLEFRADYDQTPDLIRLRLSNTYRPQWGRFKVNWNGQLDWRQAYTSGADATDSYVYGYGRAKVMLPTSDRSTLYWQLRGEFVQFDSVAAPSFNHVRLGLQAGYSFYFHDFSSFDISGFFQGRQVPDTSYLDYLSYGLESNLLTFYGTNGELDAYMRLEVKDYNQPADQDDYVRFETDIRHQIGLGGSWIARQELKSEAIVFNQSDALNSNYSRTELNLLFGRDLTVFNATVGPHLEYQAEQEVDDYTLGDSYFESGLQANVDVIDASRAFISLESVVGYRNLKQEADYLTNFTFERLNLLADWQFLGNLSLTALISAEWEWHDNQDENSRIVLLSSGLYYSF